MQISALRTALCLTLAILFWLVESGPMSTSKAQATESKESPKYVLNSNNPALADTEESVLKGKKFDSRSLHRLDFHVANKTCGVCILNIQTKTRALPSVVNAALEIKRPFCASVIYDSKQISSKELIEKVKTFEKDLLLDLIQDKAITMPPLVLIPPHLGNGDSDATSSAKN